MFRKRNSISKRSYKRTGRASSTRHAFDEKYPHPAKNIPFPAIRREQVRRSADVGCPIVDIPCSPGYASQRLPDMPFLPKGASAMPAACSCPAVARQRSCRHGSGPSAILGGPKSAVLHPPFPGRGTKTLPANRRRGPAVHARKKFYGERGPREGDVFSKAPSFPGKPPRLPLQKTRLPLPHPRRHLLGRARPGAHRLRRGQASATVRAGAP